MQSSHNNHLILLLLLSALALIHAQSSTTAIGKSVRMTCSESSDTLTTNQVATLAIPNTQTVFFFGYLGSTTSQNPVVARFDNGTQTWCQSGYQTSGNAAAYGALWSDASQQLFIAISTSGEVTDAFSANTNGWITSYGAQGSEEVTVILEIDATTGDATGTGTYLIALTDAGATNYTHLNRWDISSSNVVQLTLTAYQFPLDTNAQPMSCSDKQSYSWDLEFGVDFAAPTRSTAAGCSGKNANTPSTQAGTRSRSRSPSSDPNVSETHSRTRTPTKGHKSSISRSHTPTRTIHSSSAPFLAFNALLCILLLIV